MKAWREVVLVGVVLVALFGAYLAYLTSWCWYCHPCGHGPTIPLEHYRQVLLNLSASNASKVYIRHDVDDCFDSLWPVLEVEKELNFTSTICFYPVVKRRLWFRSRQAVDWERLYPYWASGWVVSYHLNAYERAGYNPERGDRLALRDVEWFRRHGFPVDRFSPHGGWWGGGPGHRLNNWNFTRRFANLSGLRLDMHWDYDFYFSDSGGRAFSVPRDINGSVYLLVHPEWYG